MGGWALVRPDDNGVRFLMDSWFPPSDNPFNLSCDATSAGIAIADNASHSAFASTPAGTIATGQWSIITFRYDGANLQIGANRVPDPAHQFAFSYPVYTAGDLRFGEWGEDSVHPRGQHVWLGGILEMGITARDPVLTDIEFCKIICYARAKYALALVET